MSLTHVHNIRFAIYWANCCGSLSVNVNVVSLYGIELEANRLNFQNFWTSCKLIVKNEIIDIGRSPYVRMCMSIGYLEPLV